MKRVIKVLFLAGVVSALALTSCRGKDDEGRTVPDGSSETYGEDASNMNEGAAGSNGMNSDRSGNAGTMNNESGDAMQNDATGTSGGNMDNDDAYGTGTGKGTSGTYNGSSRTGTGSTTRTGKDSSKVNSNPNAVH